MMSGAAVYAQSTAPRASNSPDTANDVRELERACLQQQLKLKEARELLAIKEQTGAAQATAIEHARALLDNYEKQLQTAQAQIAELKSAGALDAQTMASYKKSVADYDAKVNQLYEDVAKLKKSRRVWFGVGAVLGAVVVLLLGRN